MRNYITGFIISVALTLAAFLLVMEHLLVAESLVVVIIGLALIQFLVQLVFFLHLDRERGPRWNLAAFISTIGVVLVLVVGSLWIMKNLNYNMTPTDASGYILHDEGIQK